MSGPKVVRVITKEEIMAKTRKRMDALQDAIERWHSCALSYDAVIPLEEKAIQMKFRSLEKMFEQEQFRDVEKQCKIEIDFLQADMDRIKEEAIVKAEHRRSMQRRMQYSAEMLIKTFKAIDRQIPEELSI